MFKIIGVQIVSDKKEKKERRYGESVSVLIRLVLNSIILLVIIIVIIIIV